MCIRLQCGARPRFFLPIPLISLTAMDDSHRKFTVMGGRLKHDVCEYITAMTSESEVEVHVGCDSQNHKRHTVYVTTVVFRFPSNGAHVIYRRERVPKISDMWTKLWERQSVRRAGQPYSRGVQPARPSNRSRLQQRQQICQPQIGERKLGLHHLARLRLEGQA